MAIRPIAHLGAVARSDLRVRQLPGRCSRQAGPQTSFPAPTAAPAPGPPFPRAVCSLAPLNIYTCMMQHWAPMAWSGTQTTVQAFRASF